MSDCSQNRGNWSNPWGPLMPLSALVDQSARMLRAWADLWSSMLPYGAAPCGPQSATSPACAVCVRILSHRPAEVTACLSPGSEALPLEIHVPHLHGITIGHERSNVTITLAVTHKQKAGVFPGRIIACGREVGQVTVTIAEHGPHHEDDPDRPATE